MQINKMIATIQVYIYHVKGVEVNINPDLPAEMGLLVAAYNVAYEWSKRNLISSQIIN